MRAVLDTNVLVSAAIFPQSVPHRALDLVREHGELIFTVSSFAEIQETLFRSKFDRYIEPGERVDFVATLFRAATWVDSAEAIRVCRDPNDDKFSRSGYSRFGHMHCHWRCRSSRTRSLSWRPNPGTCGVSGCLRGAGPVVGTPAEGV